ncbi:Ion channel [Yersinia aldovae]|nr:Ion channel [Yersinia aldovae]
MIIQDIFYSLLLASLCVALHSVGSARIWRVYIHASRPGVAVPARLFCMLLLMHFAETVLFSLFYVYREAFTSYEDALYFSLSSYTTIGYGDLLLPPQLRLVGAFEGLIGTLLSGWSVALLVAFLQKRLSK